MISTKEANSQLKKNKLCLLADSQILDTQLENPDKLNCSDFSLASVSEKSPGRLFMWSRIINKFGKTLKKLWLIQALQKYVEEIRLKSRINQLNSSSAFDPDWYQKRYPDVAQSGISPAEHFAVHGLKEDRDIHAIFDSTTDSSYYLNPGPGFEALKGFPFDANNKAKAKAIAFYLPQFHPIPENDKWWGEGFTEWRNVARGVPRFAGHYQPRLPRDLGFYDLRIPGIFAKQIEMARNAGIFGFCFYYYFFDGYRLLDTPLKNYIADKSIQFPFCVMWANEDWTRRWAGKNDEVLMKQKYSIEFEDQLLADWAKLFARSNYIRIKDRPLLCIYHPDDIPNTAATLERWRKKLKEKHGEEPFIFMCQTYDSVNPDISGFDAAVEFPPHKFINQLSLVDNALIKASPNFTGSVHLYSELVKASLEAKETKYNLLKTVVPSWDNEARWNGRGISLVGSSPALYQSWLEKIIGHAQKYTFEGEPLLFINAWNEWAEGAYLEPDIHWGSAYVNATMRALAPVQTKFNKII